jgi:hypothetical protein
MLRSELEFLSVVSIHRLQMQPTKDEIAGVVASAKAAGTDPASARWQLRAMHRQAKATVYCEANGDMLRLLAVDVADSSQSKHMKHMRIFKFYTRLTLTI